MAESLWLLATVALTLFLVQRSGLVLIFMAVFFAAVAAARAIAPVVVIAAAALLFPEAASFSGLPDLLLLALIGSAVSTVVVDWLGLEMLVRRAVGGPVPPLHGRSRIAAVLVEGLITALSLAAVARFMDRESLSMVSQLLFDAGVPAEIMGLAPDASLSAGVALVAGLTSAFGFYYLGLCLDSWLGGSEPSASEDSTASSLAQADAPGGRDTEDEDILDTPGNRSSKRASVLLSVVLLGWASERLAAPEWVSIVMIVATSVVGAWVLWPLVSAASHGGKRR